MFPVSDGYPATMHSTSLRAADAATRRAADREEPMKVRGITVASRATSLAVLAFGIIAPATAAEPDKETLIRDALSAAPPTVASTATVMNWDHNVLKQGSGAYTCY